MKHTLKIGIVEDELLIAEKIKMILTEIGYSVCDPVSNFDDALTMIETEKPDLLLLDINLGKEKDGLDIAQLINDRYFLPFIFLTANSDMVTIERAKEVKPYAYLVKPFTKEELFAAIEIAANNFNSTLVVRPAKSDAADANNYTFIKDSHRFIKIMFKEIVFVESRENYVVINTTDKKSFTLRSTFSEFLAQLPEEMFFRIHRSYAIQIGLIDNFGNSEVTVSGITVPLSNTYRDGLFSLLGIKQ